MHSSSLQVTTSWRWHKKLLIVEIKQHSDIQNCFSCKWLEQNREVVLYCHQAEKFIE